MSDQEGKTTVEVTYDVWAALDKRKDRGDSFNDVIKRLIDASPVGFGELKEVDQEIEYGSVEELTVGEMEEIEQGCTHYDIVSGEQCDGDVEFRQQYRHGSEEDWSWFHYCEEHRPEETTPA